MTKFFLTNTFQKRFRKAPKKIQSKIEEALQEIKKNPFLGKKLMGELEGEYSYRVGRYRIINFVDEKQNIWIETVNHRKDVYRKT
ncbi:MAG: type II toxin-antitoxin system RelE/ParE family toxin [Candidatus Aminicenantes bacterium]|nr:type II toxin-antitoxin system RelE/ParE family toxin [Candidatus Aminicenantes bacterium]